MHNQSQVDTLYSSMIAPGFTQTGCVEVATQAHLLADGRDDFPRLPAFDRLIKIVGIAIENDKMVKSQFILGRCTWIMLP